MSIVLPSPDFAATVAAGYVEPLDAWSTRTQIPDDWAERLALAWCWSLIVDAAHVAELEARIAAERRTTDRAVTFVASGLTGRHITTGLATAAGLFLLGHRLTHWGN
ncbi:hypothetical protein ACFWDI_18985 [Streptomyces sp. NPDC060064]|uniref:hypothetical protein n=1 Tax=Streptomyces sp. NPDC060064 TaxID=3347049 RepID=UPI0036BB7B57